MTTKKATTPHGEVEYKTVKCASCEREVAKNDAQRFYIGDVQEYRDWGTLGKTEVDFDRASLRKGWACKYCANRGPVQYPERKSIYKRIVARLGTPEVVIIALALWSIFALSVVIL